MIPVSGFHPFVVLCVLPRSTCRQHGFTENVAIARRCVPSWKPLTRTLKTNLDRIHRRCPRQDNPKNASQSLEDTAAVAPGPFHRAWTRVCAGVPSSAEDTASVDIIGGSAPVQRMAQPPGAEQRRFRHLQLVARAGRADRRQQWNWTPDRADAGETRHHRCGSGHPTTPRDR